jgi:hypothetical protein
MLLSAVEAVTTIGFLGFFVFMASMGITLLRSRKRPTTPPAGTTRRSGPS